MASKHGWKRTAPEPDTADYWEVDALGQTFGPFCSAQCALDWADQELPDVNSIEVYAVNKVEATA